MRVTPQFVEAKGSSKAYFKVVVEGSPEELAALKAKVNNATVALVDKTVPGKGPHEVIYRVKKESDSNKIRDLASTIGISQPPPAPLLTTPTAVPVSPPPAEEPAPPQQQVDPSHYKIGSLYFILFEKPPVTIYRVEVNVTEKEMGELAETMRSLKIDIQPKIGPSSGFLTTYTYTTNDKNLAMSIKKEALPIQRTSNNKGKLTEETGPASYQVIATSTDKQELEKIRKAVFAKSFEGTADISVGKKEVRYTTQNLEEAKQIMKIIKLTTQEAQGVVEAPDESVVTPVVPVEQETISGEWVNAAEDFAAMQQKIKDVWTTLTGLLKEAWPIDRAGKMLQQGKFQIPLRKFYGKYEFGFFDRFDKELVKKELNKFIELCGKNSVMQTILLDSVTSSEIELVQTAITEATGKKSPILAQLQQARIDEDSQLDAKLIELPHNLQQIQTLQKMRHDTTTSIADDLVRQIPTGDNLPDLSPSGMSELDYIYSKENQKENQLVLTKSLGTPALCSKAKATQILKDNDDQGLIALLLPSSTVLRKTAEKFPTLLERHLKLPNCLIATIDDLNRLKVTGTNQRSILADLSVGSSATISKENVLIAQLVIRSLFKCTVNLPERLAVDKRRDFSVSNLDLGTNVLLLDPVKNTPLSFANATLEQREFLKAYVKAFEAALRDY